MAQTVAENKQLFLQADHLTEIMPLRLQFRKGDMQLTPNTLKTIGHWARKVLSYDIPVYIHSFASTPTGIRNMSSDVAQHESLRIAFNRGLLVKQHLEQSGIPQQRLILKAIAPDAAHFDDGIIITTRRE